MDRLNLNNAGLMKPRFYFFLIFILFFMTACGSGQPLNSPYDPSESGRNILYSSFSEQPKHLDPARSYSSNEYAFIAQIYEPPFQYHYLKRPYELIPLTAQRVPRPLYYDKQGNPLPPQAREDKIGKAVYEIKIKPGIKFQNHPAFARDEKGNYLYHHLTEKDVKSIYELQDFPRAGTRELTAEDYVYQIKRMAGPQLSCPIFPVMAAYIEGYVEYAEKLGRQLEKIRAERKKKAGAAYNQEQDELNRPIVLDLNQPELPGVQVVDRYTYRIILKKKYPQFIYWMAMPFFAPIPWEAERFYGQGVLLDRQITLDTYPIGTGAYRLAVNNPSKEMILLKNENFHGEKYPKEGTEEVKKMGLLKDAGQSLPFIEKAVYKMEKENIPYWNKFLQGYYDTSGISSDSFDQAIRIGQEGDISLSETMKKKKIRLLKATQTSTFYIGFNMLDDIIGGYSEQKRKLRQAVSIVINYEEYIQIFLNGRGIPAQSLLPPGIFGYLEGRKGINPYVYNWEKGRKERKSVKEARRLLAEAGYPGGKDIRTGRPLLLYFDTAASGPDAKSYLDWLRKRFKKIDIQLVVRSTDYNRFQDKMLKGNAQIFQWGWNADYPDPENFFFLLYGPNRKVGKGGENAANYESPEFDALFRKMANLENSPERLEIIKKMLETARKDSPWIWGFHPISFGLYHAWFKNAYPNLMANNTLKYKRIDPRLRKKSRTGWNKPVFWPVGLVFLLLLLLSLPVLVKVIKTERG